MAYAKWRSVLMGIVSFEARLEGGHPGFVFFLVTFFFFMLKAFLKGFLSASPANPRFEM